MSSSITEHRGLAEGVLLLLALIVGGLVGCDRQAPTTAAGGEGDTPEVDSVPATVDLFGDLQNVHDPSIIQAHGQYYLYSTGGGIQWRSSPNRTEWAYRGDLLGDVPSWAESITEGDLWAPDVAYFNGRYHLYYSASTFGSGRSAIGVATNPVLSPDSAAYEWKDRGAVVESYNSDPYNAIDPDVIMDEEGRLWMAFGSWNETGVRMRRLDPETGKPFSEDDTFYSLANRPEAEENAVEAPHILHHNDFYYLFVSFGHCCQGVDSDYNIRVGRSESITGPYVDDDGTPMTDGGGTLVLDGWDQWKGPGHNAVLREGKETFLVYHSYSVANDGTPVLRMSPLKWRDGWPFVPRTADD